MASPGQVKSQNSILSMAYRMHVPHFHARLACSLSPAGGPPGLQLSSMSSNGEAPLGVVSLRKNIVEELGTRTYEVVRKLRSWW